MLLFEVKFAVQFFIFGLVLRGPESDHTVVVERVVVINGIVTRLFAGFFDGVRDVRRIQKS